MRMVKLLTGAMMVLLLSSGAYATWSSSTGDQIISALLPPSGTVYAPSLAAGPNGYLYAVWVGRTGTNPYEIYFSRSTDNGATWSGTAGDVQISAYDNEPVYSVGIFGNRRIDIATDSQGRIFVVWPEKYTQADFDTSQEIMVVISTDNGATWIHSDLDFPVSDTLSTPQVNYPAIAVDRNDNIHVVWNQNHPVTNKADIFYSRSTDHGATWSGRLADRCIGFPDSNGFQADIAVGADNKIHVIWKERGPDGRYGMYYGASTDGGVTFSSETGDSIITETYTSNSYGAPRIVAGAAGFVHAVYCIADTVYYVGTTNGGVSWTNGKIFVGTGYDFYTPEIGMASNGDLIALIDEEYPGFSNSRAIYALYSFNNGLTWTSSPDPVTFNDGGTFDRAYIPTIAVTAGDTLHAVYYTNYPSSSNTYQEMAYSRNDNYLAGFNGTLNGHVYELDGTTPIDSVIVEVRDSLNVLVATDTTTALGLYSFVLNAGTYSAHYSIFTHHDTTITGIVVVNGFTTTVDVLLRPVIQGTISGTVYEQSGTTPQEGVIVKAYDSSLILRKTDTTDVSGNYSVSLYPDTYSLLFSKTNFYDTTVGGQVLGEAGAIDLDVNMRWSIAADDIGTISLNNPANYLIVGENYQPAVTIRNHGYLQQTTDLNLIIFNPSDVIVYNETATGLIVPMLSNLQQVFTANFSPSVSGNYRFRIIIGNPGDENPGNDTLEVLVMSYLHQSEGGPDDYGYMYKDNLAVGGPTYNWIDISGSGTQISPTLHYFMTGIQLPFSFEFYGLTHDSVYVNSHGQIHLGTRDVWLLSNDCPLPDTSTPHAPFAAVFWDYLRVQYENGQGVWYQYFDQPSNDYFVIQWKVSRDEQRNDSLEFEVILYEDYSMLFQYKYPAAGDVGSGSSATIGLEYDQIPSGISYQCNFSNPANRVVAGRAIKWFKAAPSCEYLPGDINGDGNRIGGDVTYGVRYFKGIGSAPPDSCFMDSTGTYLYVAGDVNGNCEFRGSDITRLVAYFKGAASLSFCHFFPPPIIRPGERMLPDKSR